MRDAAQRAFRPEAAASGEADPVEQRLRCQQTLHAAGHLVGGVAHDFNNMLSAIKGFTALLETELAPDSPAAAILDEIRTAVEHSCRLNRQLQAFSRKQTLRAERMDLNAVVRGAERVLRPLVGSRITLALDLDAELAPVRIDAAQLEQVLVNIALNARDAMPAGGRLEVRTCNLLLGERQLHADGFVMPAGRYAHLSITDSGCGMNEATRARAFEPFFTTRGGDSGAGLGLSTVFGVVKQLGGYVWIESALAAGTTVHICLPEASARTTAPSSEPAPINAPGPHARGADRRTA